MNIDYLFMVISTGKIRIDEILFIQFEPKFTLHKAQFLMCYVLVDVSHHARIMNQNQIKRDSKMIEKMFLMKNVVGSILTKRFGWGVIEPSAPHPNSTGSLTISSIFDKCSMLL